MTAPMPLTLRVNGERVDTHVLPRTNLADFLREHLQLTGTHVGCEHGVCGACTVRVNDDIVRACLSDRDVFASEFVIRADRGGIPIKEIPVQIIEKRPPSINLFKRVPNVLKNVAKLTWSIRIRG